MIGLIILIACVYLLIGFVMPTAVHGSGCCCDHHWQERLMWMFLWPLMLIGEV